MIYTASLTVHANLALVSEIALGGDDDNRNRVLIFQAKNLLVEGTKFLERVARGDGINQKKAIASAHSLFLYRAVFLLARRVQHIDHCSITINDALLQI